MKLQYSNLPALEPLRPLFPPGKTGPYFPGFMLFPEDVAFAPQRSHFAGRTAHSMDRIEPKEKEPIYPGTNL